MPAISLERSSFAQTAFVSLVTFAAFALLVLVLAYWTRAWLAPSAEPRAQEAGQTIGGVEVAYGLFGSAQRDRDGAAPTGIAINLLGVVAATGGRPAYAVVRVEGKQILAVRAGKDVAPGVRLAEVHADRVILDRNGARETLAWPERNTPAEPVAPVSNN